MKTKFSIASILLARCPACQKGKVTHRLFFVHPKCAVCGYSFYPESGFYLGAMVISFFINALLTVPPLIALKLMNVELEILLAFPFIEFIFLGTFLMFYSRILWLHLDYRLSRKLDGNS